MSKFYLPHNADEMAIRAKLWLGAEKLDESIKKLQIILEDIQYFPNKINELCEKARDHLRYKVNHVLRVFKGKIPATKHDRYCSIWHPLLQRLTGCCAIVHYLEFEELADRQTVANMLDLKTVQQEANICLRMDEYLIGLLQMSTQLSRLGVNSVAHRDYSRPERIVKFLLHMYHGFQELDLNVYLRQRCDDVKHDINKIEVVCHFPKTFPEFSIVRQVNETMTVDGDTQGISEEAGEGDEEVTTDGGTQGIVEEAGDINYEEMITDADTTQEIQEEAGEVNYDYGADTQEIMEEVGEGNYDTDAGTTQEMEEVAEGNNDPDADTQRIPEEDGEFEFVLGI